MSRNRSSARPEVLCLAVASLAALAFLAGIGSSGARAAAPGDSPAARPQMRSSRTATPVLLDGRLDEPVWSRAAIYSDFVTSSPDVGRTPSQRTTVRLAHDDDALYFAIRAFDDDPSGIKSSLVRWDELYTGDYVGVQVDALNEGQSNWGFFVNPSGSQGDLLRGANDATDAAPDKVWQAAARRDSSGYTVEIEIPLRSLRYTAGDRVHMGIGFTRHISRATEFSHLPAYSPFVGTLMSQLADVEYDELPWKRTWELLPSVVTVEKQSREGDELVRQGGPSGTDVGLTGKVGLTPTATLDLAVNPDFSQIEADAGQVDLNVRSLVYYPEKRPFFQEGSDAFALAADEASAFVSVLHTRNIIDPQLGLRVHGTLERKHRVGLLFARDSAPGLDDGTGDLATFGAARYRRQLGEQSFVGGVYTMRDYRDRRNQVGGLDAKWRLGKNTDLQANGLLTHTREGGGTRSGHHVAGVFTYRTRTRYLKVRVRDESKDLDLDTGFVPRDGETWVQPSVRRYFYPGKTLQNLEVGYWSYLLEDKYQHDDEQWHNFFVWMTMPRSTVIGLWRFFGNELFAGGDFDADGWYVTVESQVLNSVRVFLEHRSEGKPRFVTPDPYQGDQQTSRARVVYEPGPKLQASVDFKRQLFDRRRDGAQIFDDRIVRARTVLQLHRYFSLRATVDYRQTDFTGAPLRRRLGAEFLASFNYLPGTVLYAGYGTLRQSGATLPAEMNPAGRDAMLETDRSLFFKASYNWRI